MAVKVFNLMVPNDHVYVEDGNMWFVGRVNNELYKGNIATEFCELVTQIPLSGKLGFRINPLCIKFDNRIICLPDTGEYIWIYDLEEKKFKQLSILNPNAVRIDIEYCWIINRILWIWSYRLKQLMELDLDNDTIKNYYKISNNAEEDYAYQAAAYQNNIYIMSVENSKLYEFNTTCKQMKKYELPHIDDRINTIVFDSSNLWLSGTQKCIYAWDGTSVHYYNSFPSEFEVIKDHSATGLYQKMLFKTSICLNEYLCFIPWNFPETICNSVLFVNRESHEMKAVKLYAEEDDGRGDYTFEYVIDGRYIGIYYSRNVFISEIDTFDFTIKEKAMQFSLDSYTKILKPKLEKANTLMEETDADLPAFINL